jgi:Alpha/beta hydrolase family
MAVFTKPPEPIDVKTTDGCRLELRHHPRAGATRPVLLVHGASAGSDTFRIGEKQTVVDYLLEEGFDVWTLDWRASMRCSKDVYCAVGKSNPTIFTIDAAAICDVPAAISQMRADKVVGKIGIIAHCMGGAIVAQGIAQGVIPATDVENVVITALGLFYKAALDDVLKVEDQVLEQLLAKRQFLLHPTKKWDLSVCQQEPGNGKWDPLLQVPYEIWCDTPLRHACNIEYCHRVSYMQFLLHCAQNLRRGHCGPFVRGSGSTLPPDYSYLNHAPFKDRALTLITGNLNSLWHRDSIDTMYEWLRRGRKRDQPRKVRKHVLDGFAHQDLFWGSDAPERVFPLIREGLQL